MVPKNSTDYYGDEKLFHEYVDKIIPSIIRSETKVKEINGFTHVGQRFLFVITKSVTNFGTEWFIVRLIADEEHRNFELIKSYGCFSDEIVEYKEFVLLSEANEYVMKRMLEYERGIFVERYQYRIRRLPKLNARNYLKYGDYLRRRCFTKAVYHDGVYIGNGVANYNTETDIKKLQFKAKAYVKIDTFDDFLKGTTGRIHVLCFRRRRPEEICETARHFVDERYGEGKYTLHGNNCQTFATTCVYGFSFIPDTFVHQNFFSRCYDSIYKPGYKWDKKA